MVTIDALVIRNKDGASAFRVSQVTDSSGKDVPIYSNDPNQDPKPHITAVLAGGSKPANSSNFVFSEVDVRIIPIEMTVVTMSRWY